MNGLPATAAGQYPASKSRKALEALQPLPLFCRNTPCPWKGMRRTHLWNGLLETAAGQYPASKSERAQQPCDHLLLQHIQCLWKGILKTHSWTACTACSSSRPTPHMQSERAHHAPNTSLSTRKKHCDPEGHSDSPAVPGFQGLAYATNSPPLFSFPHTHGAPRKAFLPLNTSPAARPAEGCACTMNIGVGVWGSL